MPLLVVADVGGAALLEVLFLLRERPGLIRNLAAFDDALAAGAGAVRAVELRVKAGLRLVILQIPVGGDERLPDAAQIGMAVGAMRGAVRGRLRESQRHAERDGRSE